MHSVTVFFVVCLAALNGCLAVDVHWYRTAQSTTDRLTKQDDLKFQDDFSFNQVVTINRYNLLMILDCIELYIFSQLQGKYISNHYWIWRCLY